MAALLYFTIGYPILLAAVAHVLAPVFGSWFMDGAAGITIVTVEAGFGMLALFDLLRSETGDGNL